MKKERNFKKVGNQDLKPFKFDEVGAGEIIEGVFVKKINTKSSIKGVKKSCAYLIDIDKEELKAISGSAQLNHLMFQIDEGDYIQLTYLGKLDVEGYETPIHQYELQVEE